MIRRRKSHTVLGRNVFPAHGSSQGKHWLPLGFFLEEEARPMWLEHEGKGDGGQAQRQVGQITWGLKPNGFLLKAGRHVGGLCRAEIRSGVTVCCVASGCG